MIGRLRQFVQGEQLVKLAAVLGPLPRPVWGGPRSFSAP